MRVNPHKHGFLTNTDEPAKASDGHAPWSKSVPATWLDTEQAAVYVGVSVRTLEDWRHKGIGPPYYKKLDGKLVLYRCDELDRWVEQAYEHIEPKAL